jgi:hypothetical protein
MDLALRVQWHWGGSKVIRVSSASPISAALTAHGFTALPDTFLVVAHRGRSVSPQFTFRHYGVRSGDRLVCLLKRLPTREKSRRFLESLFPRKAAAAPARADDGNAAQVARLEDLEFISKEAMPNFPAVLNDLLREQDSDEGDSYDCIEPTVLSEADLIAEDPLPISHKAEAVVVWKSVCGRAPALMEQQRRGNSFDQIKKP